MSGPGGIAGAASLSFVPFTTPFYHTVLFLILFSFSHFFLLFLILLLTTLYHHFQFLLYHIIISCPSSLPSHSKQTHSKAFSPFLLFYTYLSLFRPISQYNLIHQEQVTRALPGNRTLRPPIVHDTYPHAT